MHPAVPTSHGRRSGRRAAIPRKRSRVRTCARTSQKSKIDLDQSRTASFKFRGRDDDAPACPRSQRGATPIAGAPRCRANNAYAHGTRPA